MADQPEIVELVRARHCGPKGLWEQRRGPVATDGFYDVARFARLPEGDDVVVVAMSRDKAREAVEHIEGLDEVGDGVRLPLVNMRDALRAVLAQPEGPER